MGAKFTAILSLTKWGRGGSGEARDGEGGLSDTLHRRHASFPIWLLSKMWEAAHGSDVFKVK